jgi:hypothetical protein
MALPVSEHDIAGTFIDDPDAADADPTAVLPVETDPVGDGGGPIRIPRQTRR